MQESQREHNHNYVTLRASSLVFRTSSFTKLMSKYPSNWTFSDTNILHVFVQRMKRKRVNRWIEKYRSPQKNSLNFEIFQKDKPEKKFFPLLQLQLHPSSSSTLSRQAFSCNRKESRYVRDVVQLKHFDFVSDFERNGEGVSRCLLAKRLIDTSSCRCQVK